MHISARRYHDAERQLASGRRFVQKQAFKKGNGSLRKSIHRVFLLAVALRRSVAHRRILLWQAAEAGVRESRAGVSSTLKLVRYCGLGHSPTAQRRHAQLIDVLLDADWTAAEVRQQLLALGPKELFRRHMVFKRRRLPVRSDSGSESQSTTTERSRPKRKRPGARTRPISESLLLIEQRFQHEKKCAGAAPIESRSRRHGHTLRHRPPVRRIRPPERRCPPTTRLPETSWGR